MRRSIDHAGLCRIYDAPRGGSCHFIRQPHLSLSEQGKLLQAVVTRRVKDYTSQFEGFLSESELSAGQEMQMLIRWLLTDNITEQPMRIFREL